jgi:hypothetical protein
LILISGCATRRGKPTQRTQHRRKMH